MQGTSQKVCSMLVGLPLTPPTQVCSGPPRVTQVCTATCSRSPSHCSGFKRDCSDSKTEMKFDAVSFSDLELRFLAARTSSTSFNWEY